MSYDPSRSVGSAVLSNGSMSTYTQTTLSHQGGDDLQSTQPSRETQGLMTALCNKLSEDPAFRHALAVNLGQNAVKGPIRVVIQANPGTAPHWWFVYPDQGHGVLPLIQHAICHPPTQVDSWNFTTTQIHVLDGTRAVIYQVVSGGNASRTNIVRLDWWRQNDFLAWHQQRDE